MILQRIINQSINQSISQSKRGFIYNFIHRKVAKHKQKQLTMKNNNRTRYKRLTVR